MLETRVGGPHRPQQSTRKNGFGLSNEWHVVLSKSFQDIEFSFGPRLVQ